MKKLFIILPLLLVGGLYAMEVETPDIKLLKLCKSFDADIKDIEELLTNGADINTQNKSGKTPLHMATGDYPSYKKVLLLLTNGARIDISNSKGNIPIIQLVKNYWSFTLNEADCIRELKKVLFEKIHGPQDSPTLDPHSAYKENLFRIFRELLLAHLLLSLTEDELIQAYNLVSNAMRVCSYYGIPEEIKLIIIQNKEIKEAVYLIILDKIQYGKPIPSIDTNIESVIQDVVPQTFRNLIEQIAKITGKRPKMEPRFC